MIDDIAPLAPMRPAVLIETDQRPQFDRAQSFAALLDGAVGALRQADTAAQAVALGHGNIAEAAVARAKADVALEVAAITASRVSGAVNALLQTQV
jgi:hypothetical protein